MTRAAHIALSMHWINLCVQCRRVLLCVFRLRSLMNLSLSSLLLLEMTPNTLKLSTSPTSSTSSTPSTPSFWRNSSNSTPSKQVAYFSRYGSGSDRAQSKLNMHCATLAFLQAESLQESWKHLACSHQTFLFRFPIFLVPSSRWRLYSVRSADYV